MAYGKKGMSCLTPARTLAAVRADPWAEAPGSRGATLMLKWETLPHGDEVLMGT